MTDIPQTPEEVGSVNDHYPASPETAHKAA